MFHLPKALYSAAQTRQLDQIAEQEHGLTSPELMARAGKAALDLIGTEWPAAQSLLIFCGGGHNGGDGYELARQASAKNYHVTLVALAAAAKMSAEVAESYQAALSAGAQDVDLNDDLPACDLKVDALFGTGLNRPVSGRYADAIRIFNQISPNCPALALDIPSGLCADTGKIMGDAAVRADVTLSYIGINIGLLTGDAVDFTGKLAFNDLQLPAAIFAKLTPLANRLAPEQFTEILAPRRRNSHKGLFGEVLVIGGNFGMAGAALIAAQAAARSGAGLVRIATRTSHTGVLPVSQPELMVIGIDDEAALKPLLNSASVVIIGPGLGQDEWARSMFALTLAANKPMVIDADALNLLAEMPQRKTNWVLTPHPGEAARLADSSNQNIQSDRPAAVSALQQQYGGVVVLKGAGSLISDGDAPLQLSSYGNPGMASGGMGDLLSGIIGGLLAQQLEPLQAASIAVTMHGIAGDKAARQSGERGLLATDLLPFVQKLLNP